MHEEDATICCAPHPPIAYLQTNILAKATTREERGREAVLEICLLLFSSSAYTPDYSPPSSSIQWRRRQHLADEPSFSLFLPGTSRPLAIQYLYMFPELPTC